MPLTFECGICHSTYRLDEQQITSGGVKVTCPKCLNFFFLKKGTSIPKEEPVIEHVVADGVHEVYVPPPGPNEMTADQLLSDADLKRKPPVTKKLARPPVKKHPPEATEPELPVQKKPTSQRRLKRQNTFPRVSISHAELSDYPSDRPPETAFDRYLVIITLALVSLLAAAFLHYFHFMTIPGLESVQATLPTPTPIAAPEPTAAPSPKYGFPIVEDITMP